MIKGSFKERAEYEEYIRSLKEMVRYPFGAIYHESQKLVRYYWLKKTSENREFYPNEIHILNLMSLIDRAVRIGGLIYAWWWEEQLPEFILAIPQSKADWFVQTEDIANTFINVPTKTVEAAFLKTTVSREIIRKALEAQKNDDFDALVECLSLTPLDEIFGAYKFVNAHKELCEALAQVTIVNNDSERNSIYALTDAFEAIGSLPNLNMHIDGILHVVQSIGADDTNSLTENIEPLIFTLCIGVKIASDIFSDLLGASDPIAETIREISEEIPFQRIYDYYVQFPRDSERCINAYNKFVHWSNSIFETDLPEQELNSGLLSHEYNKPIVANSTRRLEFPTRISRNRLMDLKIKKEILSGLFKAFGHGLENFEGNPISEEEFIYLFDGPVKRPDNYTTPYYWNKTDKQFAGLLRLLYFGQARGVNEIILLVEDKGSRTSSVKWSAKKQGLGTATLLPLEEKIQGVVFNVTGARLPDVDLTKQNKSKTKNLDV